MPLAPQQQAQRTYGNQAIGRVATANGVQRAPLIQRKDDEPSSFWKWKYGNKVGKEKRSSEKSRMESEALLNQTTDEAAESIKTLLSDKKMSKDSKFERVAFALSGQLSAPLGSAYTQKSGQLLNDDIEKVFGSRPRMAEYLKDIRTHDGFPSPRMMLYTALGEVTNEGFFSKYVALVPGLPLKSNYTDALGDTKRFGELLQRCSGAERRAILADSELMKILKDKKKAFWQLAVAQADIDVAQEKLDQQQQQQQQNNQGQQQPNQPLPPRPILNVGQRGSHSHLSAKEKIALSDAHELELIEVLKGCVTAKVKFDRAKFDEGFNKWMLKATPDDQARILDPTSKFQAELKSTMRFVPRIGSQKGLGTYIKNRLRVTPTMHLNEEQTLAMARDKQLALYVSEAVGTLALVFDAKKFYERVLDWKSKAQPADIAWASKPDSEFRTALKKAYKRIPYFGWNVVPYIGMNKDTEQYFTDFLLNTNAKKSDEHVAAVKGNVERQGKYVDRGEKNSNNPRVRLNRFINDKRFPNLIAEMSMMTVEQRKALLDSYDATDEANALKLLDAALFKGGMKKDERAQIQAMFNLKYGQPGGNYEELWSIVNPGQLSRISSAFSHLSPAKWSKIGGVSSRQDIGKAAYKILFDLDDEEYLQIRQDKALLAKLKEYSEKSGYWTKILDLLGMKSETDQVQDSGSLRKDQQKAKTAGKFNINRYVFMLDDAIDEKYTMTRYVEGKNNKLERKHFGEGVGVGSNKAQLYVVASQIQKAATDAELEGHDTATAMLLTIYLKFSQLNKAKALYIRDHVKPVHDVFMKNVPIPVDVRVKRSEQEGFGVGKTGQFRKTDRQKYFQSFQHVHGKQLLDEWSNVAEFKTMREELNSTESEMNQLLVETAQPPDNQATEAQRNEHKEKTAKLQTLLTSHPQMVEKMQRFTIGIKQSRRMEMKALGLNAEDRIKLEGMVSDKIINALNEDLIVQRHLDELGLPYDEYMQQKIKAIDALEMQRKLDTTQQWKKFATKSGQLKETTRNVKGKVTSTENEQRKVEKDKNLTPQQRMEQLQEIREKGAKGTEEALDDRNLIEARFRDMQASFEARAKAIFKLIAFAIITGLTQGLGAPLAIGIHIAIEVGMQALETAYDYFVLKKNTFQDVAVNFLMGVLEKTVGVLTANLGIAFNQSILHPGVLGPGGAWVDRALSRGLASLINSTVMFVPKHIVAQYQQTKALEKVIKEGEDEIGDMAMAELGKQVKGIGTKMMLEIAKTGVGLAQGKDPMTGLEPPKNVNQALNDRMMGGATNEEQTQMWGRYEKQKQKQAKSAMQKAFFMPAKNEHEKGLQKGLTKDARKEQRGKDPKNPIFKAIMEKLEGDRAKAHKAADKNEFKTIMAQLGIDLNELSGLDDEEKAEVEELIGMPQGKLDEYIA